MLLCPNQHREATVGAMSKKEQRRYKAYPHNIQHGLSEGMLSVSQSALSLQLGSVIMVGNGIFLEIDDFPLLEIGLDDKGLLKISVSLYDKLGNPLIEIHRNEWISGDPLPWDLEFGIRWLTLREQKRNISLHIDARKFPVYLRGQLWYKGHQFQINKSGIIFGGEYASSGLHNLALVAQKIQICTSSGAMKIVPDSRFGQGFLVSQPTPAERLTKSLEAWQRLRYPNLVLRRP